MESLIREFIEYDGEKALYINKKKFIVTVTCHYIEKGFFVKDNLGVLYYIRIQDITQFKGDYKELYITVKDYRISGIPSYDNMLIHINTYTSIPKLVITNGKTIVEFNKINIVAGKMGAIKVYVQDDYVQNDILVATIKNFNKIRQVTPKELVIAI